MVDERFLDINFYYKNQEMYRNYDGEDRKEILEKLVWCLENGKDLRFRYAILIQNLARKGDMFLVDLITNFIDKYNKKGSYNEEDYPSEGDYSSKTVFSNKVLMPINYLLETYPIILGKDCYPILLKILYNKNGIFFVRQCAALLICELSNQELLIEDFSYYLYQHPEAEEALNLKEFEKWEEQGCPDRVFIIYDDAKALQEKSKNKVDVVIRKLNRKYKKHFKNNSIRANHTFIHEPDQEKVSLIPSIYPEDYKYYLSRYDANLYLNNGVHLYGLSTLSECQEGYATYKKQPIEGWNENWLVIADQEADPYILNLNDGKVYFALHGGGKWEWEEKFDSFTTFLTNIESE